MFFNKFQHKIKTIEELQRILNQRPKKQKVVMCHGCFDVVHPGHVRHLAYAKSKADILVTSITADRFITKGKMRPHVPQALRAINLAAFEMVDYVIIDENPTPLQAISILKPDFFAKGYEYISQGMPTKTEEEERTLDVYGGKMLFTPGDIVYSSSSLIHLAPPSIRYEKLWALMESAQITFADFQRVLERMKGVKVHVVGDTIIDGFMQTTMIGGQTKTPTVSVLYESQKNYVGGAGIVAEHLRAAGADVTLTTLLGNDALKDFTLEELTSRDIKVNAILDENRPTTHKNAVVAKGYRLIKIDTLDNSSINDALLDLFAEYIEKTPCDMIIFSDFRHGIFNRRTIPALVSAIPKHCYKVADSQVASRWGNITEFKGFDLITPNEREARFALADQDSGIRPLGSDLYDAAQCKTLILKLGEKGILTCFGRDHTALDSFVVLDSFVDHCQDAVGAGDALLAYAALALAMGESPIMASILGTMAAACECEYDGNIPIAKSDVMKKLDTVSRHMAYSEETQMKSYQKVGNTQVPVELA
ncbi:MAG: ADP-heptose synthase [Coxiella sp. RIFCSPHIGHO2_12_FULL_42_15]|nr:MAG: ADP-heptose synthase [Coxiella sp. RIFCSPHIGHO2_12_FULL_42_15]